MKKRILALVLAIAMCLGVGSMFAGCNPKSSAVDAFVIMTENLDGLFNPFYYTAANDGDIVSMTQISMLTTDYVDGKVVVACGDEHAVVAKDYAINYDSATDKTTYTFVIKNGIKFSDGQPLTIEDVLFNMYVYLDPNYTGSSTMYSTDIVGLRNYQLQTQGEIEEDAAAEIARRSRGTPRIANRYLKRVRDFSIVKGNHTITRADARFALARLEIDELGLDETDRNLLRALIEKFGGGPTGLETLAATINEDANTIEDVYEPYLLQLGFIARTPRGRICLKDGYTHMGYTPGAKAKRQISLFESED